MANIAETAKWENAIHLIEAGEPASAGVGAPINIAPSQLANRTAYLKKEQDTIKAQLTKAGISAGNAAVVVVSETEPTDLPVGGFWLQPVSEQQSGDAVVTKGDIAELFN